MDGETMNSLTPEEQSLLDSTIEECFNSTTNTEEVNPETTDIPNNSKSLLISEVTARFSGAEWAKSIESSNVLLAGLGGIGSYVGFLLSRLNPKSINIFDDDVVEEVNLSGQLYNLNYIGLYKSDALYTIMADFSKYYDINSFHLRYSTSSPIYRIMICGFDNMEARKTFFYNWCSQLPLLSEEEKSKCLFIDGRLAAEEFQVFCLRGDYAYLIDKYRDKYLFKDEEAEITPCSYKQTSFCANMIASVIVNLFVNFHANQCNNTIERSLPFITYYDAKTMMFKTSDYD